MTNYVEEKICCVPHKDFQRLVSELCEAVRWSRDQFENRSLANLFTTVVAEQREIDLNNVLDDQILAKKVRDFDPSSPVYCVCCELARRSGNAMDGLMTRSVHSLVKKCYKSVCPPLVKPRNSTRCQENYQRRTRIICRRRGNGDDSRN